MSCIYNVCFSIYFYQEYKKSFPDMKSMLKAMSPQFIKYLNKTTKEGFLESGLSEVYIDEIVMGASMCNYGQTTDIHQFAGECYTV